jgi:hypothetical protein
MQPPRESVRVATSSLVETVLSRWASGHRESWMSVIETIESQLARPADDMADAAYRFCEDAQNAASLGFVGYPDAEKLAASLGPRLRHLWAEADAFWARVEAMAPGEVAAFVDDPNVIEDAAVRAMVIATHRRRGDGSYTTLGQIVQLELGGSL